MSLEPNKIVNQRATTTAANDGTVSATQMTAPIETTLPPPPPRRGAMAGTGSSRQEAIVGLVSGAAFGMVSPVIGHPFDLVKTRMQACHRNASLRETVRLIYTSQGVLGFYRGFIPPLIGSVVFRSLQFSAYSGTYAFCERSYPVLQQPIPYSGGLQPSVLLGALAAAGSRAVIETPLEFIKVRIMVGKNALQDYSQIGSVTRPTSSTSSVPSTLLLLSQGVRSLSTSPLKTIQHMYQGFTPTLLRTVGLLGSFFVLADYSVRYVPEIVNAPLFGPFFKGGVCATLAWCICFPFESAKSVIQADHTGQYKSKSFATWHVLRQLYFERGIKGLYRGLGPGASRSFVANGVSMIVYSWFQDVLRKE